MVPSVPRKENWMLCQCCRVYANDRTNNIKTEKDIRRNEEKTTYNLTLDGLALQLNCSDLEVNTNCADVALPVRVVRESQEQAGLGLAE